MKARIAVAVLFGALRFFSFVMTKIGAFTLFSTCGVIHPNGIHRAIASRSTAEPRLTTSPVIISIIITTTTTIITAALPKQLFLMKNAAGFAHTLIWVVRNAFFPHHSMPLGTAALPSELLPRRRWNQVKHDRSAYWLARGSTAGLKGLQLLKLLNACGIPRRRSSVCFLYWI